MFKRTSGASCRVPVAEGITVKRSRRWSAWLMVAFLAFGIVHALRWSFAPEQFPLREITVSGQPVYMDPAELRQLLHDQLGRNLLHLDLAELRQGLLAQPWIAAAELQRHWPDRLVVQLQARQAIAYWGEDALLDTEAQVFRPDAIPEDQAWPRLYGAPGQEQALWQAYESFASVLSQRDISIAALNLDDYGHWRLTLPTGLMLELGSRHELARLQRFVALYPQVLQPHLEELARVDLRYPDGAALTWIDPPDAPSRPVAGGRIPERLRQLAVR